MELRTGWKITIINGESVVTHHGRLIDEDADDNK